MFYEVKVFNKKNKLKKVISTQELSRRHWTEFDQGQRETSLLKKEKGKQKIYLN